MSLRYPLYIIIFEIIVLVVYYRPQMKFAKVMFLHLSVSHSVHRRGLQAHIQGGCWGVWPWGVSRPTPRGGCWGVWVGDLQAHTWGVCIPACTKADTPQQTGTPAGGTHPTGMHSCLWLKIKFLIGYHSKGYVRTFWSRKRQNVLKFLQSENFDLYLSINRNQL